MLVWISDLLPLSVEYNSLTMPCDMLRVPRVLCVPLHAISDRRFGNNALLLQPVMIVAGIDKGLHTERQISRAPLSCRDSIRDLTISAGRETVAH